MVHGVFPYVAMMQVAAEDTYDEYVICRGFDIRVMRFVDYDEDDEEEEEGADDREEEERDPD